MGMLQRPLLRAFNKQETLNHKLSGRYRQFVNSSIGILHMKIVKTLKNKIVNRDATVKQALKIIESNHQGYAIIVDQNGFVEGVLTDGDFRRWSLTQSIIDLDTAVGSICHKQFLALTYDSPIETIRNRLSNERRFVPLVDGHNRLVAIAEQKQEIIWLSDFAVTTNSKTFIIAEIGLNHNGSIETALKMIDLAAAAGVDSVKFQMRCLSDLYLNGGNANDIAEDLGSQYVLDLLNKYQLSNEEMYAAFDHCKKVGVIPICTPWDSTSLGLLEAYGMDAYKVASADFTNHDFLIELSKTGKTLICSTGMCSEQEIVDSINVLNNHSANFVLLHCNSTYPTPYKDVNLNYIKKLKEISNTFIGYSGHERGHHIPLAAVSMGAKVIEKHFTLDKGLEGNDHKVSLLPAELSEMVRQIRELEVAMGSGDSRIPTQGELMNRNTLAKSLIAARDILQGEKFTDDMFMIKAPGKGLQPNVKKALLGTFAKRSFSTGSYFFESDLPNAIVSDRKQFKFNRPFGVPVRFHDYKALSVDSNVDFLEFHLSYKDLTFDIDKNFSEIFDLDFIVHCPDTFEGDFLLDLSSLSEQHRKRSIYELQRTIDLTKNLKKYFNKATTPLIVVSLGGVSEHGPISNEERQQRYELMSQSLKALDTRDIEIIGQTLPPYPWYFGGQLYLNLFVFPDDTVEFCKKNNMRVCFDISHSMLTCNQFNLSFSNFVEAIAQHTAHIHIADASGVDGEGLQIGEGQVDFKHLAERLDILCPSASFIPEIWQGHKDNGSGFWTALSRLESLF